MNKHFRPPKPLPNYRLARYARGVEYLDIYAFTDSDTQIECPDCETTSPSLDNIYAAWVWVIQHQDECKA